jgi:hypothetical protein
VIIISPTSFLQQILEATRIEPKALKHYSMRLSKLLRSLSITQLHSYTAISMVCDFASFCASYSKGFQIIMEPYDERTPNIPGRKLRSFFSVLFWFSNAFDSSFLSIYLSFQSSRYPILDPILQFACLDAAIAMQPILAKFKRIIITSGTLSPIEMLPRILRYDVGISSTARSICFVSFLICLFGCSFVFASKSHFSIPTRLIEIAHNDTLSPERAATGRQPRLRSDIPDEEIQGSRGHGYPEKLWTSSAATLRGTIRFCFVMSLLLCLVCLFVFLPCYSLGDSRWRCGLLYVLLLHGEYCIHLEHHGFGEQDVKTQIAVR